MAAPVRPGDLRLRLKLQSRSTPVDSVGGVSIVWSDVATVWANITELSARELMAAQAVQSEVTHQITIRYQKAFADPKAVAEMRALLVKDGITRLFNIRGSHDNDERRRFLILDAMEGLNDG